MAQFTEKDITLIQTDAGNGRPEAIMFSWVIDGFGFGTTTFYYENNKLFCDNETLSKEQIKTLLCKFIDMAEFID